MRKLYVLPFDHRGSFAKMFGFEHGNLTEEQAAALADYKHVIYEGFLAALKAGVRSEDAAILVDEEFGAKILEEARAAGITRMLTTEKSGQDEFEFEYGDAFREHINKFGPEYVKALVRYNPNSDKETNKRQLERLKTLGKFCAEGGYKFLIELLAVPTDEELAETGGREEFEKSMQWKVMRRSVEEFRRGGVEPDIWKLEGLDDASQFRAVVDATRNSAKSGETRSGANKEVGVIVLGRGESAERVRKWISAAAGITSVVGFAVGRTVWSEPMRDFASKKISREDAAEVIARNYQGFADLFEEERK